MILKRFKTIWFSMKALSVIPGSKAPNRESAVKILAAAKNFRYPIKTFEYRILEFLYVLSIVLLAGVAVYAQEAVNVRLDRDKAFVGDIINFNIDVVLPENAHISANQKIKFENFEIAGTEIKRVSAVPNRYVLNFKIAAYKTGNLAIEPLTVFYINPDGTNNIFFTPETRIEIASVAGNEEIENIKDIKPPKKLNIKAGFAVLIALFAALAAFIAALLARAVMQARKKAEIAAVDPRVFAVESLKKLYDSDIRKKPDIRLLYYGMSEILRTYVSKKYAFDAMEMTTSEFFEKVKKFLPGQINVNDFKNYLKVFNLARYAGFKPEDKEIESSFEFTKNLLEQL